MASQRFNMGSLQKEVLELTDMLRTDETLEDLRLLLRQHGIDSEKTMLGGLLEDASGFEAGVLITSSRKIYRFERMVSQPDFSVLEFVDDPSNLIDTHPALSVALVMEIP